MKYKHINVMLEWGQGVGMYSNADHFPHTQTPSKHKINSKGVGGLRSTLSTNAMQFSNTNREQEMIVTQQLVSLGLLHILTKKEEDTSFNGA